jgi:histidine ammonia-lyase
MFVQIDGERLRIEDVHEVARNHASVKLSEKAKKAVVRCRKTVEDLVAEGQLIYGVTTGIGELSRVRIPPEVGEELQKRIVYSHSAGVGDFFEDEVRGAMLLRANVLAKGYSAVRLSTLQTLIKMINNNVVPAINEKGSVGTSGDLSPLSQMAEVVMGEGRAFYKGKLMSGKKAMSLAGIKPVSLSFKEGLGLINGSQMFTACGALRLYDAIKLAKTAMIASAMSADALRTPMRGYDKRVHAVRPFNGQNVVAANLRKLLRGSALAGKGSKKVQDAYSLRCIPQIYGPSIDALHYARQQIEIEMNSGSDNPLFFSDDRERISCGNFHGQPVAMVLDLLAIAVSEIGGLSERHINRLMNPNLNMGLPAFLVKGEGLNSGLMVAQYTAASLCSENKLLAHPAIVDNFSMAADQEDHVCMGPISARKLKEIVWNVVNILAIEMMSGAQALDFLDGKPGAGTLAAYTEIRRVVKPLKKDRVLYPDIQAIAKKIASWDILNAVENKVGAIGLVWKT